MKTAAEWVEILTSCGVKPGTAVRWADSFSSEVLDSAFSLGAVEVEHWCATFLHETGMLEQMEENLNYSAEALIKLFGRHRISVADCWLYGRTDQHKANQPMIANLLYGGEWGLKNLGNTSPGDGWKYRGRNGGLTGRSNYRRTGDLLGVDFESEPDLAAHPEWAVKAFIAWWENKIPDAYIGNVEKTRKAVNGGVFGLAHVASLTAKLGAELT